MLSVSCGLFGRGSRCSMMVCWPDASDVDGDGDDDDALLPAPDASISGQ